MNHQFAVDFQQVVALAQDAATKVHLIHFRAVPFVGRMGRGPVAPEHHSADKAEIPEAAGRDPRTTLDSSCSRNSSPSGAERRDLIVGDHHSDIVLLAHQLGQEFQSIHGSEAIVISHQDAILARSQFDCAAQIPVVSKVPRLLIIDMAKTEMAERLLNFRAAPVGRAIVRNADFKVFKRLRG